MINSFQQFKKRFADIVIVWWGCSDDGEIEKDYKIFLLAKVLAQKNPELDKKLSSLSGSGWSKEAEGIFEEIKTYLNSLYDNLKNLLTKDDSILYEDHKQTIDEFLSVYTAVSMIKYRWCGMYYSYEEIVHLKEIRNFLYNERNRERLLYKWNNFLKNDHLTYCGIVTYGSDEVFDYLKKNINSIYNKDLYFPTTDHCYEINKIAFRPILERTYIGVYTELLIEINNLIYFKETNNLEKLLSFHFPYKGIHDDKYNDEENPRRFYHVVDKSEKGHSFLVLQNTTSPYPDRGFFYRIIFISNDIEPNDHCGFADYRFLANNIYHLIYEYTERTEYDDWFRKEWDTQNEWESTVNEIKNILKSKNWKFLCSIYNDTNKKWLEIGSSSEVIRHTHKLMYEKRFKDVIDALIMTGNYNAKHAVLCDKDRD